MSEEPTQPHAGDAAHLNEIAAILRALTARFDNLENTAADLKNTVAGFGARLQNLEDKFDARSRETLPMSERINQIFSEVAATRHELREVNRTLRRMNVDLATALRNQDDIEDRVSNLETSRPQQ
jgi:chromosome segregation ATPase